MIEPTDRGKMVPDGRPLSATEERILTVMRGALQAGERSLLRDVIRMNVSARFPGTSNIYGALEDLERLGRVVYRVGRYYLAQEEEHGGP